jgi:hemoglobin
MRELPLSEARGAAGALGVDEGTIRRLVDAFYTAVREDELLGPVFARHVRDWAVHLPKMYDFWSTVVLRTGRYAGRPVEAHERIPGIGAAHFARWLEVWEGTVREVVPEGARGAFTVSAERMARAMLAQLGRG